MAELRDWKEGERPAELLVIVPRPARLGPLHASHGFLVFAYHCHHGRAKAHMKVVMLARGVSTRLAEEAQLRPKPMAEIEQALHPLGHQEVWPAAVKDAVKNQVRRDTDSRLYRIEQLPLPGMLEHPGRTCIPMSAGG